MTERVLFYLKKLRNIYGEQVIQWPILKVGGSGRQQRLCHPFGLGGVKLLSMAYFKADPSPERRLTH